MGGPWMVSSTQPGQKGGQQEGVPHATFCQSALQSVHAISLTSGRLPDQAAGCHLSSKALRRVLSLDSCCLSANATACAALQPCNSCAPPVVLGLLSAVGVQHISAPCNSCGSACCAVTGARCLLAVCSTYLLLRCLLLMAPPSLPQRRTSQLQEVGGPAALCLLRCIVCPC